MSYTPSYTFGETMKWGTLQIALLSTGLGLLLWAWFALTLTPVERHYFAAYVGSSLHPTGRGEPDRVEWILKTGPKKKLDIADPADLVPSAATEVPFALSKQARAQGWTGTDFSVPALYPAGFLRSFLRQDFFAGRSLWWLLFQPLELLAMPVFFWAAFVYWRHRRDEEERGPAWVWLYGETSLSDDVRDFTKELYETAGFYAVAGWRWVQAQRQSRMKSPAEAPVAAVVPPSAPTVPVVPIPRSPEPSPVIAVAIAQTKPVPQQTSARPPKVRPVQGELDLQPELPHVQTLPFRRRQGVGQPEQRWDPTQWID